MGNRKKGRKSPEVPPGSRQPQRELGGLQSPCWHCGPRSAARVHVSPLACNLSPSAPFPHLPLRLTARISPWLGATPHSTVATNTERREAAGCMVTGGERLRMPSPGSRSRSRLLRTSPPSFRILQIQPSLGPYFSATGRGCVQERDPFSRAGRKTVMYPFLL